MKSRERLTAGLEPDAEVRFFGGGQTSLSRLAKEMEMNDQEILMGKTKDAVRYDRFTVSDNYLKGCDYPYGGGYMVSCEGSQFGSLRFQGGGVIFNSDSVEYYIIDADEIPLLVNRVVMAWNDLMEEGEG